MLSFKQVESNHSKTDPLTNEDVVGLLILNFGYRKCFFYFNSNSKWLYTPHASRETFEQHLTLFKEYLNSF